MSEVLRARMRECLTAYQVGCGTLLDVDELAAELLESVLPGNDNDCMDEPLFRALICEWGVCTNCYGGDCACCPDCGATDADLIGSHGCPGCV